MSEQTIAYTFGDDDPNLTTPKQRAQLHEWGWCAISASTDILPRETYYFYAKESDYPSGLWILNVEDDERRGTWLGFGSDDGEPRPMQNKNILAAVKRRGMTSGASKRVVGMTDERAAKGEIGDCWFCWQDYPEQVAAWEARQRAYKAEEQQRRAEEQARCEIERDARHAMNARVATYPHPLDALKTMLVQSLEWHLSKQNGDPRVKQWRALLDAVQSVDLAIGADHDAR